MTMALNLTCLFVCFSILFHIGTGDEGRGNAVVGAIIGVLIVIIIIVVIVIFIFRKRYIFIRKKYCVVPGQKIRRVGWSDFFFKIHCHVFDNATDTCLTNNKIYIVQFFKKRQLLEELRSQTNFLVLCVEINLLQV